MGVSNGEHLVRVVNGKTWPVLLVESVLAVTILYGLATKLVLVFGIRLDSDNVGPGMISMEIVKHGNLLLRGYNLPSADTYLFTDVLPFHLLPQVITGYNPLALLFVGYFIFLSIVLLFSILILYATSSRICALIFAALAANITPASFLQFANPVSHNGTILFAAILILLTFLVNPVEAPATGYKPRGRKKDVVTNAKHDQVLPLLLIGLSFLTAFSDTIILAWFVIPYAIAYVLLYPKKTARSNLITCGIVAAAGVAYVVKTYMIPEYQGFNDTVRGASEMFSGTLPYFLSDLSFLLNQGMGSAINTQTPDPLAIVSTIALLVLIAVSFSIALTVRDVKAKFLLVTLLISFAVMTVAFLFYNLDINEGSARYLSFTALSVFVVISLAFTGSDARLRLALTAIVLLVVVISMVWSIMALGSLNLHRNQADYDTIQWLKDRGMTDGFGNYWSSNLLTYLSGEDVKIRSVLFYRTGMVKYTWNSCDQWYVYDRRDTFLIAANDTLTDLERYHMSVTLPNVNATGPEVRDQYLVYGLPQFKLTRLVMVSTPQGMKPQIQE